MVKGRILPGRAVFIHSVPGQEIGRPTGFCTTGHGYYRWATVLDSMDQAVRDRW